MPLVIKLDECIARPTTNNHKYLLTDHLVSVAYSCGNQHGDWHNKLLYLAGLMHDAGKARYKWQEYIRGRLKKGVYHSPLGSALFAFLAEDLITNLNLNHNDLKKAQVMILRICLDISDHHGKLSNINENPVFSTSRITEYAEETDIASLVSLANNKLSLNRNHEDFYSWLAQYNRKHERQFYSLNYFIDNEIKRVSQDQHTVAASFCVRRDTAKLIASDRYHASGMSEVVIQKNKAADAIKEMEEKFQEIAEKVIRSKEVSSQILELRQNAKNQALSSFQNNPNEPFYGLFLPTGLGKTLTALRIALDAVKSFSCSRIIYVAPYLAILSQAAMEIEKFTGLEVLQHHHLTLFEHQEIDNTEFLALESWQASIVATTLNQFFLAMFPKTAQQTIRIESLQKAFIIIDEPQIINSQVWNIFLKMLRAYQKDYDFRVLFVTATMPPGKEGLGHELFKLGSVINVPDRYCINYSPEAMDKKELAKRVFNASKEYKSTAVILNTIKDAYLVFKEINNILDTNEIKNINIFNISGCMTPIHKRVQIENIKESLDSGKRTIVISTQVLEAGVDLSFRKMFRALPVFPSIVQTAGRANRHGEGDLSSIDVIILEEDGIDKRKYVYRCPIAREETDKILENYAPWNEVKTTNYLEEYYKNIFSRNPSTAAYRKLESAAKGSWEEIAGIMPFDEGFKTISIFVPWGENYLSNKDRNIIKRFASSADELYQKYLDREFLSRQTFLEKKKFMAILSAFVVTLDEKYARLIADVHFGKEITKIKEKSLYCSQTGLAYRLGDSDVNSRIL